MLEQLGLGITLSMEDNFTPQANNALSSFNRLQSGAESMVANIERNMLQMRNLMMTGFTFEQLGEGIENVGQKILGSFKNMGEGFIQVNADYQTMQSQLLTSFKGNAQEAEKAFDWIRDFSAKTPFEVAGLGEAFQKLKATGIDLREGFKGANGEVKLLAEAVGDLATRNMSGTGGVSGLGYALQEAWAGQTKSLVNRFNIAKADIANMMKYAGKDATKFSEEFIKLAEKYTPNAMKNMGGTWALTVSNMKDMWHNFIYDVGKTGVFLELNLALNHIQEKLSVVFSDKSLIKGMGTALHTLVAPLVLIVNGLVEVFVWTAKFTAQHPMIAKIGLTLVGVAGVVLTLSGFIMKMAGSLMLAVSSVAMLMMNFQLMSVTGVTMSSMFTGLTGAMTRMVSTMGILGIAGVGLFFAWEKNIGGIQEKFNHFFSSVTHGWAIANEATKKGLDLSSAMKNYEMKMKIKIPPLASVFAGKFLKIIALSRAFWLVITGHFDKGVMHFTKKDWDLFKQAGIEGLVQGMVYARDKIDHFFHGFSEGLTVVYGLLKEFVGFVWTPIKLTLDAIDKYSREHPNGILGRLFLGKDGVDIGQANKAVETAERLGKLIGVVTGALVGMKVVSGLTSIITSPFRSLYNSLARVGAKAVEVKTKLANVAGGGVGGAVSSFLGKSKTGRYFRDVGGDLNKLAHQYDRTSKHPKGVGYRDGKFTTLRSQDIDSTYRDYFLNNKVGGADKVQIKNRSKIGKMLFGEDYYKKNADGSREKLGHFGGLTRMLSDDRNIENRATSLFARGYMPRENTVQGITHRPVIGDTIGQLKHMRGIGALQAEQVHNQGIVRTTSRQVTGLANSQFNRFASVRQRELLRDYTDLSNKAHGGNFSNMREAMRYREYQRLGFDPRNIQASERVMGSSISGRQILDEVRGQRVSDALNNSAQYQNAIRQARGSSLNQNVFADNKQSGLSRMLFGQRMYTVSEGANGQYNQNVIGRRGGIFRRESSDGVYNPNTTLGAKIRNSFVGRTVSSTTSKIGQSAIGQGAGRVFGTTRAGLSSTMAWGAGKTAGVRTAIGKPIGAVGRWYNRQRERVGLAPRVPRGEGGGFKGAMRATGGFLFGSNIRNAEGAVVGRRQGAVGRVGRGVLGVGRGVGRGVGALGGLAMGAMPWMMLGGMAFKGISAKGAGVSTKDKKAMGLDPKASDFQVGLKTMQQGINKISFAQMYAKMKKEGSGSFKIIGQIAKDVFKGLKSILPQMMKDAWQGIKGIASLTWIWIKTDGIKLMGQLGNDIVKLLGQAWQLVCSSGGKMLGQLATFVIGTLIPKIIQGVVQLGIFIITHIPQVLQGLAGIALGIFKGIWEGVKQIFSGIASFLKEAFTSAFSGLGRVILGALSSTVRAIPAVGGKVAEFLHLPAHHGGLWMSNDEHMAVIKKDETVLPPDKSRQLNDILEGNRKPKDGGAPVRGGGGHTDNSIKINKVEVIVQADRLSRDDARKQALMVVEELKKLKREKQVRSYEDISSFGLNL